MNFEFLRTLHGFINLLQVCFGFAAIFASSLIWADSNLYFQFIYKGFGWQTLILFILVITFLFAFVILFSNVCGKDVLGTVGKKRLLLLYAICLILLIVSASLETWYIRLSAGYLHSRFIAVTVFNWLLVVSYVVLIVVTILFV
ncbi:hypothetical protein Y032_0076g1055 [Ancylostoma ceylanicum]|uniref:MARVEL domain-containing protein n=1 Tax=Ancylostoma ceylanicum TaxID=53326 RepID=A0A016TVM8_9BILA|nr:hypothetical protein Y032_0076g1055 [Ancylostoma ceylanicum]